MKYDISINKMLSKDTDPISYYLTMGSDELYINELIGEKVNISYSKNIYCNWSRYHTIVTGIAKENVVPTSSAG